MSWGYRPAMSPATCVTLLSRLRARLNITSSCVHYDFKLLFTEWIIILAFISYILLSLSYCLFIILVSAFAGRYCLYGLILLTCVILFMILPRILDVINFINPISLLLFWGDLGNVFLYI